jgi:hypothetical protein
MGIREDQIWGLTEEAIDYLCENEIPEDVCPCCRRPFPRNLEQIDHYSGMGTDYPLYRHRLLNGEAADEFVQTVEWSSGPCIFLGLCTSDGVEFLWTEEEIAKRL